MPLYEYYCPPCGHEFEVLRPVAQMDNPAVCPSGHTTNNRVLSLFARPARYAGMDSAPTATATMPMMGGDDCCSPGAMGGGHGGCSCC